MGVVPQEAPAWHHDSETLGLPDVSVGRDLVPGNQDIRQVQASRIAVQLQRLLQDNAHGSGPARRRHRSRRNP